MPKPECPDCGERARVFALGLTRRDEDQRWECWMCGRWFVERKRGREVFDEPGRAYV